MAKSVAGRISTPLIHQAETEVSVSLDFRGDVVIGAEGVALLLPREEFLVALLELLVASAKKGGGEA